MSEFLKVIKKEKILSALYDFSDIFPHLCEKIDSMEDYAEKLSRHANFYLGVEDERAFGIAVFYSNDLETKTAYISLIGIKKSAQNKGLGGWLLSQCEEKARQDGMVKMMLEVDCDNDSAIFFYKKNGYKQGEKTERDSMYMHKEICKSR